MSDKRIDKIAEELEKELAKLQLDKLKAERWGRGIAKQRTTKSSKGGE